MAYLFPRPSPRLPDYRSLLVKGLYHASAPVHLLLSHTTDNPEARAILLTPHRDAIKNDLVNLNDAWISDHSGRGRNAAAAQRTEVFYPPSLAHLRLLLSMLHEYDDMLHHAKTTLDTAPTLLVLHEISEYFTTQASDATVSAYLSVISSALALTASWSPRCQTVSRLVVFDSGLGGLKLPILKNLSFDESEEDQAPRRDTLSVLLERYIEWRVEFPEVEDEEMPAEDEDPSGVPQVKTLKIRRLQGGVKIEDEGDGNGNGDVTWTWSESVQLDDDGKEQSVFLWD